MVSPSSSSNLTPTMTSADDVLPPSHSDPTNAPLEDFASMSKKYGINLTAADLTSSNQQQNQSQNLDQKLNAMNTSPVGLELENLDGPMSGVNPTTNSRSPGSNIVGNGNIGKLSGLGPGSESDGPNGPINDSTLSLDKIDVTMSDANGINTMLSTGAPGPGGPGGGISSFSVEACLPLLLPPEALEDSENNPSLTYQIARQYVPVLSASSYERLCQEPASLENELHFLKLEMENLASHNVGAFLENTTLVSRMMSEDFPDMIQRYKSISSVFGPLEESMQKFRNEVGPIVEKERSQLKALMEKYTQIQELLETPHLLDSCIRNAMFDEALDLLAFCNHMFSSHRNRVKRLGSEVADIPIIDLLEEQVNVQREHFEESLKSQLCGDIHLPACVKIIGYIRRLGTFDEEQVRELFLQQRGKYIQNHRSQIDRNLSSNPVICLRAASDLLRTHVFDIGMHYKALFSLNAVSFQSSLSHGTDGTGPGSSLSYTREDENSYRTSANMLGNWLHAQLRWFLDILVGVLAVPNSSAGNSIQDSGNQNTQNQTITRLDANSIATIYKCVSHCSNTLKMLGCHFFQAAQQHFHRRMLYLVKSMLESGSETFSRELYCYDWVTFGAPDPTSTTGASGQNGTT